MTLAGWLHKRRDHGGLIFIDLRDRSGLVQIAIDPSAGEAYHTADEARAEYVLQITGTVHARPDGLANPNMPTGEIEVEAEQIKILNTSKVPPFPIDDDGYKTTETLRLKYRYLDLRRQRLQKNLILRHKVIKFIRDYMDAQGFIEIETPMLIKSTPEGARDYVVPCRVQPGKFYALPQSPQQLKQLLMVAGYERYFQIARCFRDEDLRGDRQPEFTQLDLEMSFVERDDVLDMVEGLFTALVPAVTPHKRIITPFPKLAYKDVMERYGIDKPDLRFGMEIVDLTEAVKGSEFKVFAETLASGGAVKAICAPGCAAYSRKQIDEITEFVKGQGAKGLVTLAYTAEGVKGSAAKFLKEAEFAAIADRVGAKTGDLVCIVADQRSIANKALGLLRLEFRDRLESGPGGFAGLRAGWWTSRCLSGMKKLKKWTFAHHPFTMPKEEDLPYLESDPGRVFSNAYDMVCNGYELASGSIRIHRRELQAQIFKALGYGTEEMEQPLRAHAGCVRLRRAAARRHGPRHRSAGDADGGRAEHPRSAVVPQDGQRQRLDVRRAVGDRREAAAGVEDQTGMW